MTRKIITILCILAVCAFPAVAQDNEAEEDDYEGVAYTTGEQVFGINVGTIFPLFAVAPLHADDEDLVTSIDSANIGVSGSLELGFFVQDNLMLGGELAGMFATTDLRTLTMIPLTFVTTYYIMSYPFEFPISINAGITMNTLGDYFKISPLIKPGVGAYWNMNGEWAFGINCDYWFIPEIYFSEEYADETRLANFLQFSLSAVYHF